MYSSKPEPSKPKAATLFISKSASPIFRRRRTSSPPPSALWMKVGRITARRKACLICATPSRPIFRGTRHISVTGSHVCVVPGGKPIIFFPMLALLEPGDEVIYPDPGFPIYRSMINFLGATPMPVPLLEERGFSFDLDILSRTLSPKTKLVILNSPQNPTGGVIPPDDIRAIAAMLQDRDVIILSDEIYSRIYYTPEPPLSIASLPGMLEKTIILDGFSKTYAMTGWRLGYGVMPGMAGRRGKQTHGQFQFLRRQFHPARRDRCSDGPANGGRSHGCSISRAP